MKRESKYVNRVELLITLDYLFKYTDEQHPATCPLICKHATKYGFVYDSNQKVGNEINRHRISSTLNFLYDFSREHKGIIPFEIKMTDGGKYYAEKRNNLSLVEVMDILESINISKLLISDEKLSLISKVKKAALNNYDYENVSLNKRSDISFRKYSIEYISKLRLLKKAMKKNKLICIRKRKYRLDQNQGEVSEISYNSWHRVYKLTEFKNRMFVILVSVNGSTLSLPIEQIEIVDTALIDEFEEKLDINDRLDNFHYNTIDEMLKDNKILVGESNFAVPHIFVFRLNYLNKIKESFEDFFSIQFEYEKKKAKDIIEELKCQIDECSNDEIIGYCKIKANSHAFLEWVRNDYFVAREITIISPQRTNKLLAYNFSQLNNKYAKFGGNKNGH